MAHEVIIGPLAYPIGDADLERWFASCGAIEHISQLSSREHNHYAMVGFMTQRGQQAALSMDGAMAGRYRLTVNTLPDKVES